MTGPRPAGRPWTRAEVAQLHEMIAAGVKVGLIARKLKRSPGAIYARISALSLGDADGCILAGGISAPLPFGPKLARAETIPGVNCNASSTRITHELQCMFLIGSRVVAVPGVYAAVKAVIDEKMRIAGHDSSDIHRCIARLDALRDAWVEIADKQTKNGDSFFYANEEPVRRPLQDPFGQRTNMSANRAWFIAARSMRDTEPVSLLKIRSPDGRPFE